MKEIEKRVISQLNIIEAEPLARAGEPRTKEDILNIAAIRLSRDPISLKNLKSLTKLEAGNLSWLISSLQNNITEHEDGTLSIENTAWNDSIRLICYWRNVLELAKENSEIALRIKVKMPSLAPASPRAERIFVAALGESRTERTFVAALVESRAEEAERSMVVP